MVAALFLAAKSQTARRSSFWGYTLLALLVIAAITAMHHLSSYALALFLVAWSLLEHTQLHARLADGGERVLSRATVGTRG
jgi:hypothetical protein